MFVAQIQLSINSGLWKFELKPMQMRKELPRTSTKREIEYSTATTRRMQFKKLMYNSHSLYNRCPTMLVHYLRAACKLSKTYSPVRNSSTL